MRDKIILVVAIVLMVLAFWMTGQYLRNERAELYKGAEKVKILVADRHLLAGTVLEIEDLAQKSVFKTAVGENVFRPEDLNRVLGKKLRYSLKKRDPLWWSHVEMPERGRTGLAPMIRPGLRAVSISVGGAQAVSGLVQPNDRVDILGTFSFPARDGSADMETVTLTVLQDVSVLATGRQLARQDLTTGAPSLPHSSSYSTVTLEVSPREAELLVFAQTVKGELSLSLRNPDDVSFEASLPEIDFEHLENKLPELNRYRQQHIRHKRDL
jgi:pilus assembly protein CpaB